MQLSLLCSLGTGVVEVGSSLTLFSFNEGLIILLWVGGMLSVVSLFSVWEAKSVHVGPYIFGFPMLYGATRPLRSLFCFIL